MFSRLIFADIETMLTAKATWICNSPDAEITGVDEYEGDAKPSDVLCICSLEDYKKADEGSIKNAIVYAPNKKFVPSVNEDCNLIVVYEHEDIYKITTSVLARLSAFVRLGSLSLELQHITVGGHPLDNIVARAYKELCNPIVVTDASFVIMSKIGLADVREPQWAYAELNGSFPSEFISSYLNDEEQHAELSYSSDNTLLDDNHRLGMNHKQTVGRLVFRDKTIGYLLVLESNRKFTDFDNMFIPIVASYLSQILGHNDHKLLLNTSFHEDFLTSILSEAITSPEEILLKQETFGIKLEDTLRIIVIDMPLAVMDSDTTQGFIRQLRLFFKTNSIVAYENAIVILMDSDNDDQFLTDAKFKAFEDLLNEYDCKANISSPFHYLYQTRRHYMQAMMCSTLRNMLHIEKPIIGYLREMAEYHMIFNYSMVQNLDNLLHPAVIKLRKMDAEAGTDMLETLFAFTDHLCNLTATAKSLYLHYNTLKYRIDKIAALTDLDFTNSADVHRIVLSKKVLEIEDVIGTI